MDFNGFSIWKILLALCIAVLCGILVNNSPYSTLPNSYRPQAFSSLVWADFDWKKCAELHNRLLDIGWAAVEGKESRTEKSFESWWDHYFGDINTDSGGHNQDGRKSWNIPDVKEIKDDKHPAIAAELERRLSPSIIQFLKTARHDYPGNESGKNLFYYVACLNSPTGLLKSLNALSPLFEEPVSFCEEPNRYLWLYWSNFWQGGAIIFDQKNAKAVHGEIEGLTMGEFFETPPFDFQTKNSPYGDLESMLSAYLEMYEQKRVQTASDDSEVQYDLYNGDDSHAPWYMSNDDETLVEITISAWNELISAIKSRMPAKSKETNNWKQIYDTEAIESCNIQNSFIKKFLHRLKIPSKIAYIAPGLRIESAENLCNQPFKDIDANEILHPWDSEKNMDMFHPYPFLFLRFDKILRSTGFDMKQPLTAMYNDYPWQNARKFDTGLYLTPTMTMQRPDGCKLLLPFPITAQNWARFGDGRLLGESYQYDGLYQPGFNYVLEYREGADKLRLELLFKKWTSMIENGYWQIGEKGVLGGMNKFKEADSAKWELYFIERTW